MHTIVWEHYPLVASNMLAREWLDIQAKLGLAHTTIKAYGHALNDFLSFCQSLGIHVTEAKKADIAAYISNMASGSRHN